MHGCLQLLEILDQSRKVQNITTDALLCPRHITLHRPNCFQHPFLLDIPHEPSGILPNEVSHSAQLRIGLVLDTLRAVSQSKAKYQTYRCSKLILTIQILKGTKGSNQLLR